MSDTNDITYNSSQEIILFSSQTLTFDEDDQPLTQELVGIHTQEASNASDFFDNLRESQVTTSDSSTSPSKENQIKTQTQDLTDVSVDSFNDSLETTEKKKRGRKRKIRTPQELEIHLKEKKEKNRLAAQRLRQKKGTEVAKYDQEVVQLEANVRAKRQFLELIESNVNQLRNKIKIMFGKKLNTSLDIKIESIEGNGSTISDNLNGQENSDQNRNKKQSPESEPTDASNHSFCVSR